MPEFFIDSELGEIEVRRYVRSRGVKMQLSPKGRLIASSPHGIPLFIIKQIVRANRQQLQKLHTSVKNKPDYTVPQQIGKSHSLGFVISTLSSTPQVSTKDRVIVVKAPTEDDIATPQVQSAIQEQVIKALKKEAKAYLPRRLAHLAAIHGYSYETVRFTHAGTRWGSCSSQGTISLNIALMKLDTEVIDYVLIHELCHTWQMNHSTEFWELVERADPQYKLHKKILKNYSPAL